MCTCYWCGGDLEYDFELDEYVCSKCGLTDEGV